MYAPMSPVQARDRGLELQRSLTVAVGIAATGLLGVFAIVAAATIPGHAGAATFTTTDGSGQAATDLPVTNPASDGPVHLQPPASNSVSAGGTVAAPAPVAVTGGSR